MQEAVPLAQGVANFESIMKALKLTLRDEHCCYSRVRMSFGTAALACHSQLVLSLALHAEKGPHSGYCSTGTQQGHEDLTKDPIVVTSLLRRPAS